MHHPVQRKQELTAPRQRLIELMQQMSFCRIHRLQIQNGEPLFDPPPAVVQDLKIGGNNDPRVQFHLNDFALKEAHIELFHLFDEIQNGVVAELEVRSGLPMILRVNRTVA